MVELPAAMVTLRAALTSAFHEAERLFAVGPGPARKWPPVAFGAVVGLR
jgi:hypothetical protein